jgi:hypothetical protein
MPDRSLRLLTLPPQPLQGGEHRGVLLRERPASPPDAPSDRKDGGSGADGRDGRDEDRDNPFAPPPEGTPDRPWQPRRPADGQGGEGSDGDSSPWGSQWSDRQPGRSSGGFGQRPGSPQPGPEGQGGNTPGPGMRWDPTDPAQRRARYALLCGMWAFFFALFSWPYVALLLGALALYWGVSSLRARSAAPQGSAEPPGRPQTTAAVTGLVTAALAIALVAASFTARLVYSDYYSCTNDALTNQAKQSCSDLLPKELRGLLGTNS